MKKWTKPELDMTNISDTKWGNYPVGAGNMNPFDNSIKSFNANAKLRTSSGDPQKTSSNEDAES